VVPAVTPVTVPDASTVADDELLLHVPPDAVLDNVVVAPASQTEAVPVIAGADEFTVMFMMLLQPALTA
jgi:hypothetical protein